MTAVLPQKLVFTNANLRELSINQRTVIRNGKLEGHRDEPNSNAYIVLDGDPNVALGYGFEGATLPRWRMRDARRSAAV